MDGKTSHFPLYINVATFALFLKKKVDHVTLTSSLLETSPDCFTIVWGCIGLLLLVGFFFFFFLIIFFYLYLVRCGIFPLDVKFYLNRIIRELFMQSKSVEVKDSSINPNFFFSVYPLIINIGKDKVL